MRVHAASARAVLGDPCHADVLLEIANGERYAGLVPPTNAVDGKGRPIKRRDPT